MNRRVMSVSLMSAMRPFLQTGTISGQKGQEIVTAYQKGNDMPLRELVYSPDVSPTLEGAISTLSKFLDQ